jgi:hypothetical protein
MTDEQTGLGWVATTLRPLAPEEAADLFLASAPEQDYHFYVLDPPPAPFGQMDEGQWVESFHVSGWNALGVWELRHDPLLLRLRPLWIDHDQVARQHNERGQRKHQVLGRWLGELDQHHLPDTTGNPPFQPLRDAPSVFWGTPREIQALVAFLRSWLGDTGTPEQSSHRLFARREPYWPEDPPDLEDAPEIDDPTAVFDDGHIGEPPEDAAPWPPDDIYTRQADEAANWLSDELSDEPSDEPPAPSEALDALDLPEPVYTYTPSPDVPSASEVYTIVLLPTWRRAQEGKWRRAHPKLRRDPQLGVVEVDAFSVDSYRLEDLRDPDWTFLWPGVGYIDLDGSALQELIGLLQAQLDHYIRITSSEALRDRKDAEDESR